MTRRTKAYVRNYPHDNSSLEQEDHPNSSPVQQLQDCDQDSDLEGERIEFRQHDVTDPDHRPIVHDHLGHDDIVEQWFKTDSTISKNSDGKSGVKKRPSIKIWPITVSEELSRLIEFFYVNRWDMYGNDVFNVLTSYLITVSKISP